MLVEVAPPPAVVSAAREEPVPAARRLLAGLTPYLYLLPALSVLLVWVYKPLAQTVQYSFYSWDLLPTNPQIPVGLANYRNVVTLPQLWSAVAVSGFYLAGVALFAVAVPIGIGVLTQRVGRRARSIYRALIFVPVLVSPIVAATVWSFLLTPHTGLVDRLLAPFGGGAVNWLTRPEAARVAVLLITAWKFLGISVLIVSAGLAAISPDYYEAAAIDGASGFTVLRRVTLPLLSPTVLFLVMTTVLLSSQIIFPVVNALTTGGPAGATTDIYYLLYTYGFSSFDVGYASAAAVLFFLAFGLVAVVVVRLQDRLSFYDR
jgi:multiple sugar transport system permease protein